MLGFHSKFDDGPSLALDHEPSSHGDISAINQFAIISLPTLGIPKTVAFPNDNLWDVYQDISFHSLIAICCLNSWHLPYDFC